MLENLPSEIYEKLAGRPDVVWRCHEGANLCVERARGVNSGQQVTVPRNYNQ